MAAPGIVGTASGEIVGSGSFTVTPPAGAVAYLAVGEWYGTVTQMTPPTGFTLHTRGTVNNPWSNWGIWTAEASPGSSWSKGSTSEGGVVVVQGYDAAFTIDQAAGTNESLTAPTVTTSVIARIIRLLTIQPFNSTPTIGYPASATDGRFTEVITNGAEHWVVAIASVAQTATGATGTATFTLSGATSFGPRAHTLAISSTGGGATDLVVADLTIAAALDALALTQAHALTAADLTLSVTLDATGLTQAHSLSVDDMSLTGTLDALAVTQAHQVTAEDLTVAAALDGAALTQAHALTAADMAVAGSLDAVALEQAHALEVADLTISGTLDPVALVLDLDPAGLTVTSTLDHVALTQAHTLAVADLNVTGLLDHVELSTATVLAVDDLLVATALDAATLTQGHALTAGDLTLTLTLDGVTLGQDHTLTAADLLITSALDGVGEFPPAFTVARSPRASIAGNTYRAAILEPTGTATLPGNAHRATITSSSARAEMT